MEPLATDSQIVSELLSELDTVAGQWTAYHDQHPGDSADPFSRDNGYRAGLQLCADQLRGILARHRRYAEV